MHRRDFLRPGRLAHTAGQILGALEELHSLPVAEEPPAPPQEFPLVAAKDVERLGALGRVGAAVSYLVFGNGSKK